MARTKKYFGDRIISALQNSYPNIDFRIDIREVYLVVDDIVNSMARDNYFENMKLYGMGADDQYITEWSGDNAIAVVDVTERPSYLVLPATYAALPNNAGIVEIWPMNYEYGAVKIVRHEDIRKTRNLMSGNFQGELAAYPKYIHGSTPIVEFNQVEVSKNFSDTFGVRLVHRGSTAISELAPYPVPSSAEEEIIRRGIEFFDKKRMEPTDLIRDKNDALNRN